VSTAFAVVTAELARGALRDLERSYDTTLEITDYLDLIRRKTAELFKLCGVLGAGPAGLYYMTMHRLGAFGGELGIAFQIVDDCLDLQPDPGGKPAGTDHLLRLFGAPTLHALRVGAPGLADLLLSPALTVDDLPRIRALITESGGLTEADRLARQHFDRAVDGAARGYRARAGARPVAGRPVAELTSDVLVLGAGIAGTTAASLLAEHGLSVILTGPPMQESDA
jgi:geranylgeranyl pyrophosphate synthase